MRRVTQSAEAVGTLPYRSAWNGSRTRQAQCPYRPFLRAGIRDECLTLYFCPLKWDPYEVRGPIGDLPYCLRFLLPARSMV